MTVLGGAHRRAILERLTGGPLAVAAELVAESSAGTRRLYRINPAGLEE